ncbi:MAG: DsrE family protein [Chloroflexi bacterium]|nr:DsrE family protein [Chloroflexota bacterium]
MAKKKVVVLARRSPTNTRHSAEALRQSIGLTLAPNDVTVILMDSAAWLAVPGVGGDEIQKHLDTLKLLKVTVAAEEDALARYGVPREEVPPHIVILGPEKIGETLAAAEAVIAF